MSPNKSELLLYRPLRQGVRGLTPLNQLPIALFARNDQLIPHVEYNRILGLLTDVGGCNDKRLTHITAKTESMLRLVARVSGRKKELGEENLLRIHHAFLVNNINYVASALNWTKT